MLEESLGVEVRLEGDDCPLADASRRVDATIDADPPQLRDDGYVLLRFTAPDEVGLVDVLDDDDRLRYLYNARVDGRRHYRCLSKQRCVVHALIDRGFLVESMRIRNGTERVVGAVGDHEVLQGVMQAAGDDIDTHLERVYPMGPSGATADEQRWDLTPAQAEALRTAHEAGYFSVPRETTAAEVADELGISKSAFLERLRRGQAALLDQVF
ncbi:MAG: helix-turn-helix domain-containing protein [Halobacteriales archaeon]